MIVRIKKGSVLNVVPMGAYESIYKPRGWEIVEDMEDNSINVDIKTKGIINENQQNTYIKAKKDKTKYKFNDGLFKGE